MADRLDQVISEKRAEVSRIKGQIASWQGKLDKLAIELHALELAASLRPGQSGGALFPAVTGGRRGRQPGAISKRWREILVTMAVRFPEGALTPEVVPIATERGLPHIRPRDVQRQMEHFSKYNYVKTNDLNKWVLTDTGAQKFNDYAYRGEPEPPDDEFQEAVEEIEAE